MKNILKEWGIPIWLGTAGLLSSIIFHCNSEEPCRDKATRVGSSCGEECHPEARLEMVTQGDWNVLTCICPRPEEPKEKAP